MELVIGTKRWSTWSLRPWLVLKRTGTPFTETLVPLREVETFAADDQITPEEFRAYKFDVTYSLRSTVAALVGELLGLDPKGDADIAAAQAILATWDYTTKVSSRGAALAILTAQPVITAPTATSLDVSLAATRTVINWDSFSIGAGNTVQFVQPNVSSIVLNRVTGGSALFGGLDLLKARESELAEIRGREISMIFQEPMTSLNPVFTVGDQIAEVLEIHRGLGRSAALARAAELIALVGLPAPRGVVITDIWPGGPAQRAGLSAGPPRRQALARPWRARPSQRPARRPRRCADRSECSPPLAGSTRTGTRRGNW